MVPVVRKFFITSVVWLWLITPTTELIPGFNGDPPPSSPFPLCRIQILNVHVPHFHLKFIADFGVRMLVAANFTFKVFR